jgi:hypothetical protein
MNTIRRIGSLTWGLVKRNPVRAQALAVATVTLGTAFGLGWDGTQVGAVTGLTAAALAFLTESAVTPLEKPVIAEGSTITVTTPNGVPDRVVVT